MFEMYDAILMSNHGVVAYGDTLEHAYMKMETVEHFAQIALVTHLLGRQQPLKEREIEKLLWRAPSILERRTRRPCQYLCRGCRKSLVRVFRLEARD